MFKIICLIVVASIALAMPSQDEEIDPIVSLFQDGLEDIDDAFFEAMDKRSIEVNIPEGRSITAKKFQSNTKLQFKDERETKNALKKKCKVEHPFDLNARWKCQQDGTSTTQTSTTTSTTSSPTTDSLSTRTTPTTVPISTTTYATTSTSSTTVKTESTPEGEAIWNAYKIRFNKEYRTVKEVEAAKMFLFRQISRIKVHNEAYAEGKVTFTVDLNEFSDSNLTETRVRLCRTVPPKLLDNQDPSLMQAVYANGPSSIDWRSILQPIVNQNQCGACWAFATVAQLESMYLRNSNGYKFVLSPQYLIDCSTNPPNTGCSGGWPRIAMEYILNNGIPIAKADPYKAIQSNCKKSSIPLPYFASPTITSGVSQYNLNGNEELLKNLVAHEGPVVVAIWASERFLTYKTGVFYDFSGECAPHCDHINHAVLLVGFGVDIESGLSYWLIRNSWGKTWGEDGYGKLLRNGSNNCNTACYVMFLTSS